MTCFESLRIFMGRVRDLIQNDISVEPVVFLYLCAIFMEMSVTQDLIMTKLCLRQTNVTNYHECHNLTSKEHELLTTETAEWIGYYSLTMFFFAILTTSYIGSWSDRFSRKFPMFIPPLGSLIAVSTLIISSEFLDLHVSWLLVSGAISGASGGIIAIVATTFGYIADITSIENRTKRIVVLEAHFFIGGTLGMIIGGALHKRLFQIISLSISSYTGVFFLEFGILTIVTLYIGFHVKDIERESRPSDMNRSWFYKLFNINHIRESLAALVRRRNEDRRLHIVLILIVSLLVYYSLAVQTSLNFVYLTSDPIHWNQTDYSYYTGLNFGLSGVALILGLPICFYYYHFQDTTLGLLGVFSKLAGLVLLGLSYNPTMVYLCPLLFLFSEFSVPSFRSILSKLVDGDERGKILALMQLLQNFAMLTGAQIFNPLYKATHLVFKGLCFEIVAGLQAVAIAILLYLHFKMKNFTEFEELTVNEVKQDLDDSAESVGDE